MSGVTMPRYTIPRVAHCSGGNARWLIWLIAVLVVLLIAVLLAEHVHVGVH